LKIGPKNVHSSSDTRVEPIHERISFTLSAYYLQLRYIRCVAHAYVACAALDGNSALAL